MADAPGQARTTVGQGAPVRHHPHGRQRPLRLGRHPHPDGHLPRPVRQTLDILRIYNFAFTRTMVSKLDYFHPSLSGQATLSAVTWDASWWGS